MSGYEFDFNHINVAMGKNGKVYAYIELPQITARQVVRDFLENQNTEKEYTCILQEKRKKRSLDQNGYYWELCGQLSGVLGIPPKKIYQEHIKDIGNNYEVVPIKAKAVEKWMKIWNGKGIGFLAEDMGDSKIEGFRNIRCYFGSSTYNTKQMSRLLDLMIADCKLQGIQTITPEELQIMRMYEEGEKKK